MSTSVDTLLERLPPARRAALDTSRLAELLAGAFAAGQRAWPHVPLSEEELAASIVDRMAADEGLDLDALGQLRLADLYLAGACVLARGAAIASFRAQFLDDIESALRQVGVRSSEIDEVTHLVLEEILVHDQGRPAIAGYSGRGSLRRWVRSVAIRIASNRYHLEQREAAMPAQLGHVMAELDDDAELQHLKQKYAPAYQAALEAAVAALDVDDRHLLRSYFIDGLTIDDLARLHDVHRSTAARWVVKARARLYADVVGRLRADLGMSPSEIASLGRFVRSRLDVSFSRLLQ